MQSAERGLALIADAQISGSASQWKSALRKVVSIHSHYEPVKALALAEMTTTSNLATNFKTFMGLFGDMMDHAIFPYVGAGFYGMARDHHTAADLLSQAIAKFGHRYDLDTAYLYHACAAKPKMLTREKALDAFLSRYDRLPVAYHASSFIASRFIGNETASRVTQSLLAQFPGSNVADAARRDQAYFQGNLAMAVGFARVVVAHDKCSSLAWITLAELLKSMGQEKDAIEAANRALDLAPLRREIIDRHDVVCALA